MTASVSQESNNESMNILLVGNNPSEISTIHHYISSLKRPLFRVAVIFGFNRIFRKIRKFKPESILIDDRMNRIRMKRLINRLHRNPNTREIPITLLKSSNDEFRINANIDNYVLKDNLTSENLHRMLLNSLKLRRTSIYLYKSYKKSRNLFEKIWLDLRYRL
jgi:CheY-like chemotaxis protein